MKAMFNPLLAYQPVLKPKPQNNLRSVAIPFDDNELEILKRLVDREMDYKLQMPDSGTFRLGELLAIDAMLPKDSENVILTLEQYDLLMRYVYSRMVRLGEFGETILPDVDFHDLYCALVKFWNDHQSPVQVIARSFPFVTC